MSHPFAQALADLRAIREAWRDDVDPLITKPRATEAIDIAIEAVELSGHTVCTYCGEQRPKTDREGMLEHILTCGKRPEARLTQAVLDTLIRIEEAVNVELRDAFLAGRPFDSGWSRSDEADAADATRFAERAMERIKAAGALTFTPPEAQS